jgi:hypothetical protein
MDDQEANRKGGGGVKSRRRFIRVLFWGAVVSTAIALALEISRRNNRCIAIGSAMMGISLAMAVWVEWKMATKK